MKLRIASRSSKLALVQTHLIIDELRRVYPILTADVIEVITAGDQIQDKSLAELGGKGLFIKSLEEKLLAGDADIAMHSLKDMPPHLDDAFCIAAVLKRQSPHDVLVSERYNSIATLPKGAIVGTSSVRRAAALLHLRADLEVRMIRGNVDTRLTKLNAGLFDALILAEAGLRRLGLEKYIKEILSTDDFPPSVGQGIIAIECLQQRTDLIENLQKINDVETFAIMRAERAMNHALNASCTSPVGSFARLINQTIHLTGVVWSANGQQKITTQQTGSMDQPEEVGQLAAKDLIAKGALALLTV